VPGVGAFGLGQLSRGAHVGGIGEYRRERHPLLFVVAVMAFLAGKGCSTASRR
jgi:hypothetical protein